MAKMKKDPKMTAAKAVGTGKTRLNFDNSPIIWPTDEMKKTNPKMEDSMFGKNAIGSEIGVNADYAAGSKKEYKNEKVFDHEMPNQLWPTENY